MSNIDTYCNKYGRTCDYNHYGDHSEIRPYNNYQEAKEYFNLNFKKIPEFMKERIICKNLCLDKPEHLDLEDQLAGLKFEERVDYIRRSKMEESQDREYGYKKLENPTFYYKNKPIPNVIETNIEEVD